VCPAPVARRLFCSRTHGNYSSQSDVATIRMAIQSGYQRPSRHKYRHQLGKDGGNDGHPR
jgi:hypothetical protein